jgi:hypothetical protein
VHVHGSSASKDECARALVAEEGARERVLLLARDPTDKPPALKRFKKSFFFSMILELDWLPSQMAFFPFFGLLAS